MDEKFHRAEVNYKPYAAYLLVHPAIDALIALRQQNRLNTESGREIRLSVAWLNLWVARNPVPNDALQAKFSVQMGAAVPVAYGRATDRFFSDEIIHAPHFRSLISKVNAVPDSCLTETEAIVTVLSEDGGEHTIRVATPKGDPRNPMSFEDITEKARDLGMSVLSRNAIDRIAELVGTFKKLLKDVSKLVRLCCADR